MVEDCNSTLNYTAYLNERRNKTLELTRNKYRKVKVNVIKT
jgi:hypothetical protein